MQQTIDRLRAEFAGILKENEPDKIREFFVPKGNMDELVVKVIMWSHYFLPKYFSKPTPQFHYELVEIFFRPGNDYTACPRGFAKTTLLQACTAYSCVHGLDEFIPLIEKTFTEASEVLEALRDEFKLNDEILRVYGDLTRIGAKGKEQSGIKDSAGDFFINGVRLRAKGFDTPIRGLKSRHSRPTRVIIDDCESDEHIDNVEQRKKYLDNYIKGVIPAIDNDIGKIKMFGTILHDDSLLNTLIKNHNGKIYAAWDKQHELLWPSNWTVEKLEQKREEMRLSEKGDSAFYQEYFNQPLSDEDQKFRREMFRYFNGRQWDDEIKKKPHRIYTLVDPAISKKTTADFTAIISVAVDFLNRVYILEITRARLDPLETIKAIFAHYERWQPVYVGIETVAYQKALKYFIEEEKRRQSSTVQSMVIQEIRPTTDKVTKIMKLQPKYAIANVYHNSDDRNTVILEEELTRFPKGVHDDVCTFGLSKIKTINGDVAIMDIVVGDMVLTQKGYKKVLWAGKTGTKKVITRFGLSATPNHRVWTKSGWKSLDTIREDDIIKVCEKQLSTTEKIITETQSLKEYSTGFIFGDITNGKSLLFLCIGRYGLIILEKLLKAWLFITRMAIHLIMKLIILNLKLIRNTANIICKKKEGQIFPEKTLNRLENFIIQKREKFFGKYIIEDRQKKQQQDSLAKTVIRYLEILKKTLSFFAERNVKDDGKIEKKKGLLENLKIVKDWNILQLLIKHFHAKTAEQSCAMHHGESTNYAIHAEKNEDMQLDISQNQHFQRETANSVENIIEMSVLEYNSVLKSVSMTTPCVANGSVVDVYNLEVEGVHEFFANGILVHNCDALSGVIEIMIPVSKTVDRKYNKFAKTRMAGVKVSY